MKNLMMALEYVFMATALIVPLALGLYGIFISRESLVDNYKRFLYNVTHDHDSFEDIDAEGRIVMTARLCGIVAIGLSVVALVFWVLPALQEGRTP